MQFRKFGKLDLEVSVLGFGCMRLPTVDGTEMGEKIDEDESIRMIRYAIDQDVTYIDTAYPYHSRRSEIVIGKALKDGYRDKIKLATKSPTWLIKKTEDFDRFLNEQLVKLQTDYVDFYLFHSLNKIYWDNTVLKLNLLEKAESALDDGRIKYLGFSFHDKYDAFKEIIDGYDRWTFCQIQYNYLDIENQAGTQGLKYAASQQLAVVVMEPLLGGRLANPPKSVQDIFDGFKKKRSPSDWALQWVWNHPEVSVVLSGMSTMDHIKRNIASANISSINSLGVEELQLIQKIQECYSEKILIPCTKCGYCMPCPNGVDIPRNLELYNDGFIHEDVRSSRIIYKMFMDEDAQANNCVQCRICEEKCPQKISVSEWMAKVRAVLGEGKSFAEMED